mgnify:CR=1 FL=1
MYHNRIDYPESSGGISAAWQPGSNRALSAECVLRRRVLAWRARARRFARGDHAARRPRRCAASTGAPPDARGLTDVIAYALAAARMAAWLVTSTSVPPRRAARR